MTAHPYSPNYQAMGDCNVCGLQRDDNPEHEKAYAMTPIASLLAAVEDGSDLAVDELRRQMASDAHDKGLTHYAHEIGRAYYRKDVTAAIVLCEAMLPGVCWRLEQNHGDGCMASLALLPVAIKGFADTPAHALLIAVLRALVAKEGV